MDSAADLGKLFVGGISWDTNEDHLRDYFNSFGEVVEAVIMKDRTTGRARGFGFVVFADPAVAERVVMEKHTIDGRTVEAKKAVPRDDPHILNRNNSSIHASPGPGRTKKIFVGGLPSTITENEFKKYFDQFGTITDVVVMYDHNTQRPRGFGFITYDSEDAVDKVLLKTFHELNGKMVEVKKAVPKELSPGPSMRSPVGGYNYAINRVNSFINGYTQGYNSSLMGNYGMRMDSRLGTVASGRTGFPAFGPGFGLGLNIESSLSPYFGGNPSYNNNFGYGRNLSPYYSGSSGRYNSPIGFAGGNLNVSSVSSSMSHNIWDNGVPNYVANPANSSASVALGSNSLSTFGNSLNWGSSSISAPIGGNSPSYVGGSLGYNDVQNNFGLGNSSFGRSIDPGVANTSLVSSTRCYEGPLSELYAGSSVYGDPTWQSSTSELDEPDPMGHGLDNAAQDISSKGSAGYMGGYKLIMSPLSNQIEKDEVLAGMLSVRYIHKPNGAS